MEWYELVLFWVGVVTSSAVGLLAVLAPVTKWSGDNWLLEKLMWFRDKVLEPLAPGAAKKLHK